MASKHYALHARRRWQYSFN